jgi:hypothetical protein
MRLIAGAFLFGSAVNDDGLRFEPAKSDLDVIVAVPWAQEQAEARLNYMATLAQHKIDLEYKLLLTLQRDSASTQIVSLVPMTAWEIAHAIHKDGNSEILASTKAIDLVSGREIPAICAARSSDRLRDSHVRTLGFVQKQRAQFVGRSANGIGSSSIKPHADPIPKELMRHFAIATADEDMTSQEVTDLDRGLRELELALDEQADSLPIIRNFRAWLGVRRGARGTVNPVISPEFYALTCELIYDRIVTQYDSKSTVSGFFSPPSHALGRPRTRTTRNQLRAGPRRQVSPPHSQIATARTESRGGNCIRYLLLGVRASLVLQEVSDRAVGDHAPFGNCPQTAFEKIGPD